MTALDIRMYGREAHFSSTACDAHGGLSWRARTLP